MNEKNKEVITISFTYKKPLKLQDFNTYIDGLQKIDDEGGEFLIKKVAMDDKELLIALIVNYEKVENLIDKIHYIEKAAFKHRLEKSFISGNIKD